MRIDWILLAALAFFGALGVASGAIKQASKLIGLAVGLLFAKPVAEQLAPMVLQKVQAPEFLVNTGLAMATFPLLYAITALLSLLILKRVFRDQQFSKADRALGFVLGSAKAVGFSWIAVSALVMFWAPAVERFKDDWSVGFVAEHNFFRTFQIDQIEQLKKLADKSKDEPGLKALMDGNQDPNQMLNNPEIQKLLADPQIQAQIKQMEKGR